MNARRFAIQFGSEDMWLHMENSSRKAKGLLDVKFVQQGDSKDRPTLFETYGEAAVAARALEAIVRDTNEGSDAFPALTPKRV